MVGSKDSPTTDIVGDAVSKERMRLVVKLASKGAGMAADYKNTIKHTGGLLTQSMTYAYSKGFQDALKLLTAKEDEDVQVVTAQTEAR